MRIVMMLTVLALVGCHNHPNRSARLEPGDLNGDGIVDELDLDILNDVVLGPDVSDPLPPGDCDQDGDVDYDDVACLFDRLCFAHRCGSKCKMKTPRPHKCR